MDGSVTGRWTNEVLISSHCSVNPIVQYDALFPSDQQID